MKKKHLPLILAVSLTIVSLLAACSTDGDGSPSAGSPPPVSSSVPAEAGPDAGDVESANEETPSREEDASQAAEREMIRIDADGGLRMRTGPGTDYDIIKLLPQNSYVEAAQGEADNPDWLYVSHEGDLGWVSKEFISYESAAGAAPEYDSPSWAEVYHAYLSTFEPVVYTSTMYESTHTVAGRMVDGEKIACSAVSFHSFDGYAYPVLVCWDGNAIDADGNMDGPAFVPNVYLVENEALTRIDSSDPKWQTFMLSDGYPEPKGREVAGFSFKPENGGDPKTQKKPWHG